MVKNITFSADAKLIHLAREGAEAENTTLNEQFRIWLEHYAQKQRSKRAKSTIERISRYADTGGRKFSREDMNER